MHFRLTLLIFGMVATLYAEPQQATQQDIDAARKNILSGTAGEKDPILKTAPQTQEAVIQNGKQQTVKKTVYSKEAYLLNWLYQNKLSHAKTQSKAPDAVSFMGTAKQAKNDTNNSRTATATIASVADININGYCEIPKQVTLTSAGILEAYCDTNYGKFLLKGELIPDRATYQLIAKPIYIENSAGKRFYVDGNASKSYITNHARNNFNIASAINNRAIDKFTGEAIQTSTSEISSTSKQYLADLKASRTQSETTLVANAGATTSTTTAKPVASDYTIVAGITVLSNLISKAADLFYQDLPWQFMIHKGSIVHLDATIKGGAK